MEAVLYEHQITRRSVRLRRLKLALSAFLGEPATAREVRVLALFVRVPTPSAVETVVPAKTFALRRKRREKKPQRAAAASRPAPSSSTSKRPKQQQQREQPKKKRGKDKRRPVTKYTRLRAKLFARKHKREVAVQHCTTAAFKRIRQANRDAAILTRWLHVGAANPALPSHPTSSPLASSCPRCYGRNVVVTVAAVLEPKTIADISLFTAWQSPTHDAPNCSPLREADTIVLSLGGGSESVEMVRVNVKDENASRTTKRTRGEDRVLRRNVAGFVNRKVRTYTSFFVDWEGHGSPRIDLNALLLPHQVILLDITWCVHAGVAKYASGKAKKPSRKRPRAQQQQRSPTKEESVSKAVLDLHTFLDSFQGKVKLPKESRVACWLSYHADESVVINAIGDIADEESGDDVHCAGPLLFTHFTGISGNAPHTMYLDQQSQGTPDEGTGQQRRGRRRRPCLPMKQQKEQTRKNFSHLHTEMALLYRRLFGSGGSEQSLGRNTDWTLLLGYGGAIRHLVEPANAVALPAVELTVSPNEDGRLKKVSPVADDAAGAKGKKKAAMLLRRAGKRKREGLRYSLSSSALLLTRGQRDLYAFLAFLIGRERLDLYSRATAFLRTHTQRLSLSARSASRFASSAKPITVLEAPPPSRKVKTPTIPQGPQRKEAAVKRNSKEKTTAGRAKLATSRAAARKTKLPTTATAPAMTPTQRFLKELLGATAAARRRAAQPPRNRARRLLRTEKRRQPRRSKKARKAEAARSKPATTPAVAKQRPRKDSAGAPPSAPAQEKRGQPATGFGEGLGWTVDV